MCQLLDEACSWAEKLFTDKNLPSLMPDEDTWTNFGVSLVLENDDVTCNPRIVWKPPKAEWYNYYLKENKYIEKEQSFTCIYM